MYVLIENGILASIYSQLCTLAFALFTALVPTPNSALFQIHISTCLGAPLFSVNQQQLPHRPAWEFSPSSRLFNNQPL
jgi:hypothetical protein